MSDLLQAALGTLAGWQEDLQSIPVVYRRGMAQVDLAATVGHTEQGFGDTAGGVQIRKTERDFIVTAAKLILSGDYATPVPGDFIDVVENDATQRYEAVPPDEGSQCFRRDEYGIRFRVHTRFFKTL